MAQSSEAKRVVEAFLADFGTGEFELLAEDAVWTVQGTTAISGRFGKEHMRAALGGFIREAVDGAFEMKLLSIVAEGDQVAAQCRSFARLKDGRNYENEYHNAYTVRDGRIVAIVEYLDTASVDRFFGPAPTAATS